MVTDATASRFARAAAVAVYLQHHARPLILATGARRDSCILSTRIALDVARRLDVPARALPVRAVVFNPPLALRVAEHTERTGEPPEPATIRAWQTDEPGGGWAVGCGFGDPRPGFYAGHLVALFADRLMLDLSIDQAERPARMIPRLAPTLLQVAPDFLAGETPAVAYIPGGVVLRYETHDAPDYQRGPDWNRPAAAYRPVVDLLVEGFRRLEREARNAQPQPAGDAGKEISDAL